MWGALWLRWWWDGVLTTHRKVEPSIMTLTGREGHFEWFERTIDANDWNEQYYAKFRLKLHIYSPQCKVRILLLLIAWHHKIMDYGTMTAVDVLGIQKATVCMKEQFFRQVGGKKSTTMVSQGICCLWKDTFAKLDPVQKSRLARNGFVPKVAERYHRFGALRGGDKCILSPSNSDDGTKCLRFV